MFHEDTPQKFDVKLKSEDDGLEKHGFLCMGFLSIDSAGVRAHVELVLDPTPMNSSIASFIWECLILKFFVSQQTWETNKNAKCYQLYI